MHAGLRGLTEPISRVLTFHPADGSPRRRVTVSIGMPERDPNGPDWRTLVTLRGAGKREEHYIHGVDGMQTIVEALFILPTFLRSFPGRGRHTFLGSADLRFVHLSDDAG